MKYLSLMLVFLLAGCSAITEELEAYQQSNNAEAVERESYIPPTEEGHFHSYVERLARQLFDTANMIDVNRSVLVGTFLPVNTLKADINPDLQSLGIQLQESFSTLATQAGLRVVEFKSLSGVMITDNADLMLSRELDKLDSRIQAQYLLTGTYVEQENSLIVNAKLISVNDKTLVAAATDYLPLNSLYSHSKIKIKDGLLYRGEY